LKYDKLDCRLYCRSKKSILS